MFFDRRVFVIDMFSYVAVDEACCAKNILLIAAITCELVHCISSEAQSGVRDGTFVSSTFALRGGVGYGLV